MLIKGYTTLAEVSEATGIPGEEFTATFGVPAAELDQALKDIKDIYGFTPEDVRVFVETRLQPEASPAREARAGMREAAGPCYTTRPRPPARAGAAASRRGGRAVECGGLENR